MERVMTYSYYVLTPEGGIGVADNPAGYDVLKMLLKDYGNCTVEVRDRERVFGHGVRAGAPMFTTTIKEIL
jgi:hypothetical protein